MSNIHNIDRLITVLHTLWLIDNSYHSNHHNHCYNCFINQPYIVTLCITTFFMVLHTIFAGHNLHKKYGNALFDDIFIAFITSYHSDHYYHWLYLKRNWYAMITNLYSNGYSEHKCAYNQFSMSNIQQIMRLITWLCAELTKVTIATTVTKVIITL